MTDRVQHYREATTLQELGCGDSHCQVVRPQGMHTNGGCRCPGLNRLNLTPDDRSELRALVQALARLAGNDATLPGGMFDAGVRAARRAIHERTQKLPSEHKGAAKEACRKALMHAKAATYHARDWHEGGTD